MIEKGRREGVGDGGAHGVLSEGRGGFRKEVGKGEGGNFKHSWGLRKREGMG
jgi:hypothetical protein